MIQLNKNPLLSKEKAGDLTRNRLMSFSSKRTIVSHNTTLQMYKLYMNVPPF